MKKGFALFFALMLLLFGAANAATNNERAEMVAPYVPADAVLIGEEFDDGYTEWKYRSADGVEEYELRLDGDMRITEIEYERRGAEGGKSIRIDEEAAFARVTEAFPDAEKTGARIDRDDGRYAFVIDFCTAQLNGSFLVNAEDGTVMEYQLFPLLFGNEFEEAAMRILSAQYPGIEIEKVKVKDTRGRDVYEVKAEYHGRAYEFEIDAASEVILKWEADD